MPSLYELQSEVCRALTSGNAEPIAPLLTGGGDPRRRFAIHQRHFEASLASALVGKFPATVWLVGSDFVSTAARAFVRTHPPTRPCIAEYGGDFPAFLGECDTTGAVPYLRAFAELEWHLGQASIDIDGVRYMSADWAVDDLIKLYLTDSSPAEFELAHETVWLEVRGSRGDIEVNRLAGKEAYETRVARGA